MDNNEITESTKEELKQERFAKEMQFANAMVSYKNPKETSSSSASITIDMLQQALKSPYDNAPYLQQVSKALYYMNGVYTRLIEDFANIPMYDLYLVPTTILGFNGKSQDINKLNKEYETIAQLVEKENYKYNFKWFGRHLLLYGELYLYKVEDNNGIFFKVIPNDICRVSGIMENNIYKYSIDMSKLSNEELLQTLPIPLQRLYEQYKAGSLDPTKLVGTYYHLSDNEAVAFLYDDGNSRSKGVPPLCYLFDKIFALDSIEDEDLASSATDNLKIVHQKAPINDEGELLIEPELLEIYHRATKSTLPKNIALATNPLPMEVFTLNRQGSSTLTTTQKAYEYVYTSAGVNSELFNGSRSSSESILNSIKTDEMVVDRFNGIFGNFLNYEIKNKKKNALWKAEMVRNTYYNKKEMQSEARNDAMAGCGKLRYLATLGYTPLSSMSSLIYESQMNLGQYFNPLSSGYNSGATESENGRPTNKENPDTDKNAGESDI